MLDMNAPTEGSTGGRFWGDDTVAVDSSKIIEKINARAKARAAKVLLQQSRTQVDTEVTTTQHTLDTEVTTTQHTDHNAYPPHKRTKLSHDELGEQIFGNDEGAQLFANSNDVKITGEVEAKSAKKKKRRKKKTVTEVKDKEIGGFTVLADVQEAKVTKVKRVLPYWIKNPSLISDSLSSDSKLVADVKGLSAVTRQQLRAHNISILFPVQQAVLPALLTTLQHPVSRFPPRDICVSAPTGSGKTLAYVLPIVEMLQNRIETRIQVLVLLPVQELAKQVHKVFVSYAEPLGLKVGLAVGQKSFRKEQLSLVEENYCGYESLVDILVATPGRLTDHMARTPGFCLAYLRFLVLDEADKLLSGEAGDVIAGIEQAITKTLPPSPCMLGNVPTLNHTSLHLPMLHAPLQRLLFSATLSHDPEQLQQITLNQPMLFTVDSSRRKEKCNLAVVGQYSRPAELSEQYVVTSPTVKPLVIHHLIKSQQWRKTLIFTNSKEATHKLALLLQCLSNEEYSVKEFSADQGPHRAQIVAQFTAGTIDVLVSSDAMARGIDIANIDHVISYNLTSLSTYIHRIGRTARAGKSGTALSLITSDEIKNFKSMMIGTLSIDELPIDNLENYEHIYIEALKKMKEIILEEKKQRKEELLLDSKAHQNGLKKGRKVKKPFLSGSNKIQIHGK